MTKAPRISGAVLTYNEEGNIRSCLESMKWCDEVVVIDSGSTDGTIKIAKEYTQKIFYNKFENDFSQQRNYAISKTSGDWIFFLDADESLPHSAHYIVRRLIRKRSIDGYWFSRRNYITPIKYLRYGSFYPDYQLRLFRNKPGIRFIGRVHEQPSGIKFSSQKVKCLEIYHSCTHTKYDSIFSFSRFIPYIQIEAQELSKGGKSIITLFINGLYVAIRFFFQSFIRQKGYKDGFDGFRASMLHATYLFMIYSSAVRLRIKKLL